MFEYKPDYFIGHGFWKLFNNDGVRGAKYLDRNNKNETFITLSDQVSFLPGLSGFLLPEFEKTTSPFIIGWKGKELCVCIVVS